MNTSKLAQRLKPILKRKVRTSELEEIAVKLGKTKRYEHEGQCFLAYYWSEEEIENVLKHVV